MCVCVCVCVCVCSHVFSGASNSNHLFVHVANLYLSMIEAKPE